jgi:transporter family-2 protein
MQAPINSRLGKTIGSVQAATFSFLLGTVVLVVIASFVRGGLGTLGRVGDAPWWALIGGLLGAVYVTIALVAVRTLGAGGITAAVISGNLAIAVVIDRFGLFGVERQPIGLGRVIGLVLLAVGVLLVVRK